MAARRRILVAALAALAVLAASGAARAAPPSHALTVLEEATPRWVASGRPVEVPLLVRNDGALTWRADAAFHVAYHLFDDLGRVAQWDGDRTPLPHDVAPGSTVEIAAALTAAVPPGVYALQWDLVEERVCWAAERDPTPEPRRRLVVLPAETDRAFELVRHETPRGVVAGRQLAVPMTLRNTGTRPWPSDGSIRVAAHWRRPNGELVIWEGQRTRITDAVEPGAAVNVTARLMVPRGLGAWRLEWDMVDEGVCWFSERSPGSAVSVRVTALPELADPRVLNLLTVLAALVAGSAMIARHPAPWLSRALSVADLVWLVAALSVVQHTVLREAGGGLAQGASWRAGSAVAILVLPLVALPRRVRPWLSWSTGLAVIALLVADLVYVRYFGELLAVAVAAGAGQTGQVLDSVGALLEPRDLWLVAHLVPGAVLALAAARTARPGGRWPVRAVAGLLLAAAVPGVVGALGSLGSGSGFGAQVFSSLASARHLGVLGYHLSDVCRVVQRRLCSGRLSDAEYREVVAWFRDTEPRRAGTGPRFGVARGASLVMVQVESMQSWVVGLEVDGQPVTPWLEEHRREWITVPGLFDQTAQGRSSDAELATQTSLLPASAGAAAFIYPDNEFTGIGRILAGRGYRTISAVAFQGGFWNRRVTHRAFGYSSSLFADAFAPGEQIGWGLNDVDFLAQMADRLGALERPFCAYLITLSLHHPFASFPAHRRELRLGRLDGTALGNYLHTMRLLDRAIGAFVESLDARGLGGETVVVLWGDHDAELGWDPEVGRLAGIGPSPAAWWRSDSVPFMIRVPGHPGAVVQVPGGHVDVAPTVLALLGVDPAPYAFIGRNLLGEPGTDPVVGARGVWHDGERLWVPHGVSPEDGECWSLRTGERVPESQCAAGERAVERERRVARAVLDHDLQRRLLGETHEGGAE